MLKQTQAALHDHVLQDGTRGNVDCAALGCHNDDGTLESNATAEIDGTGDGKMVELKDLGDGGDALLEV